jgi:hypothetical protein
MMRLDELPAPITERFGAEDDPGLWSTALQIISDQAAFLSTSIRKRLFAEVGACSHWIRPHQTRWTAAGGFAWPEGYGDGEGCKGALPTIDWRVVLQFDDANRRWTVPTIRPDKRSLSVRLTVPTRTARHGQAAVHAIWPRGTIDARFKKTMFYGFRQRAGTWELKAQKVF